MQGKISGKKTILAAGVLIVVALIFAYPLFFSSEKISYETQVKPILNKHCIKCHGGVKMNGGLSLITREETIVPVKSGKVPIVPGHPDQSELIRRLLLDDPEDRMPQDAPPLSAKEIDILKKWIAQGAEWELHWAYKPLEPVEVPKNKRLLSFFGEKKGDWAKSDLDYFIFEKMKEHQLEPSPEAPKATLLRRVSLDLTGLPAPEHIAQQFLENDSPRAYGQLVDSLLNQPTFGERWAAVWLDIARYSDSKGYEKDGHRNVWRYRDWVIRAFNDGMPYDRFLQEQMAGDLKPEPSDDDYLATTFHRLTSTNDEGGTDNEEFRTAAVIDRVATIWQGVLGTTFACAQCHGHPYDPIRHKEYFQFMAYFNNSRDEDTVEDYPVLRHLPAASLKKLDSLRTWLTEQVQPEQVNELITFIRTWQPSINTIQADSLVKADLYDQAYLGLRHNGIARLRHVNLTGKQELIFRYFTSYHTGRWSVHLDRPDGPLLFEKTLASTDQGWKFGRLAFKEVSGVHTLYFKYHNPVIDPTYLGLQFDWVQFGKKFPGEGKPGYKEHQTAFWELLTEQTEATPILFENPADMHRTTRIFDRGNWLTPTDTVQPGLPAIFPDNLGNLPPNRLAFAHWLTSPENPLTARTMVNHLWAELFGQGIALTVEDLGSQGIPPTHPELLDWLAGRFMHDHLWNFKAMLREMVLSATYRQDSKITPERLAKDPYNQWYAHASRVRLSAEQVRDQALAVSGLLSEKMYGPPVMPYQPEGIWKTPYSGDKWQISEGEDRHRRSIYTFWKRSAPYPSAMIFDSAAKDVCTARRVRTNTPLQALVTLNDEVFFEAACHLAVWMKEQNSKGIAGQIQAGYRRITGQQMPDEKRAVFDKLYQTSLTEFQSGKSKPDSFLRLLEGRKDAETAALAVVANSMLNLDEVVVRE